MNKHPGMTARMAFLLVCVVFFPNSANAIGQQRTFVQNATGVCQAALPNYEGLVRKRPLALQNESASNAFVSCSMMGTGHSETGPRSIDDVRVGIVNFSGNPVDVTCTLIDGILNGTNAYFTKTQTVPVTNEFSWEFFWDDSVDNGGENFYFASNMSCNLPSGTGISYTMVYYVEDVGE